MELVHRIIRQEHVETVINHGVRFAPCQSFVDLLEFRLAYCHEKSGLPWPQLASCVGKSFDSSDVNHVIAHTCVSCWSESSESWALWEIYGSGRPSIRLSVGRNELIKHVINTGIAGVAGSVRYGLGHSDEFQISMIRPEFITPFNGLTPQDQEIFHLFFRKHDFYSYEDEFRIVLFDEGPVIVPMPHEIVHSVTLPPCSALDNNLTTALRLKFGNRLRESTLRT